MTELILAAALVIETVLMGAVFFYTERQHARERAQLLDRLMARSYTEYVIGTATPDGRPEIEQGSDDAREREWAEKNGLVPV